MRPRTFAKGKKMLKKLLRSGSSLLKVSFKTFVLIIRSLAECILAEALFWLATLGLGYLLVSFGISNSMALPVAVFLAIGLLIVAVLYSLYQFYRSRSLTKNKRTGEIRLADSIARFFARSSSAQWSEYQDWLHDILLARRQLLDEQCPRWKVKLITYKRLSVFCLVVGIGKIKQVALNIRRSR